MDVRTDRLEDLVRVDDPDFYANDPFPVYRRLQQEAPVHWYEPMRTWVLTKYEDVRYAARTPDTFSVAGGIFVQDAMRDVNSAGEMFGDAGEQIGLTDPPRHRELRRVATPPFTAPSVEKLRARVEAHCDELLDQIEPGVPLDWVETVAAKLPVFTACTMLGLPHDNSEQVRFWSDELERLASPLSPDELNDAINNFSGMVPYIEEHIERKRREPGDDMISVLLAAQIDGAPLSAANLMMFTQTMIAAGNDTTRALMSGLVATLAEHPGERMKLVADPSLVPAAIEETMRWVTPARGFIRTVIGDAVIRGIAITPGEHVYLAYDAANRDDEAFPNADIFDITAQRPNTQIAFGYGTHVCIGAPIVRMEARALLERLIRRFPEWQIAGDVVRTPTVLRSGWITLPVRFGT